MGWDGLVRLLCLSRAVLAGRRAAGLADLSLAGGKPPEYGPSLRRVHMHWS